MKVLNTQNRQVSAEEGNELALKWRCSWTEASAKNNENVQQVFELCLRETEKDQRLQGNGIAKSSKQSEGSGSGGIKCIIQ